MPLDPNLITTHQDKFSDQGAFDGGYIAPDTSEKFSQPDRTDADFYAFLAQELNSSDADIPDNLPAGLHIPGIRQCTDGQFELDVKDPRDPSQYYRLRFRDSNDLIAQLDQIIGDRHA